MKKARLWLVALLALLTLAGLGYRVPDNFIPGVYQFVEKSDVSPFVNIPFYYREDTIYSVAPKDIKNNLDLSNAKKTIYGSFELGNLRQNVYYAATINKKDEIDGLYVDLNRDGVIDTQDRVLLYIPQEYKDGTRERTTNDSMKILVDYRTSGGVIVHKYISFKLLIQWQPQRGAAHTAHVVTSWFLGEARFMDGKNELPVKIAVIDGDGDGIFNDFNKDKDLVVADVNYDGQFEKNEIAAFNSLFELKSEDHQKIQYRNYIFAWPYRLAIIPVTEWKSGAAYEPSSDGDIPVLPKTN